MNEGVKRVGVFRGGSSEVMPCCGLLKKVMCVELHPTHAHAWLHG